MQGNRLKRAALVALALFVLAVLLHTGLELTHRHVHSGFAEDCTVCQHLKTVGRAFAGALRAAALVPLALSLMQAGLLLLAAVALLRETPTTLKVKMND